MLGAMPSADYENIRTIDRNVQCTCTPPSTPPIPLNIESIRPKRALSTKRMPKQCEINAIIKSPNVECWMKEKTCQNWWFAKYINTLLYIHKYSCPNGNLKPKINYTSIHQKNNKRFQFSSRQMKWSDKNKIIIKCSNHFNIIFQAADRSTRVTSIKRPYTLVLLV